MNPLRSLFLMISRMPPAVMLSMIIGLAMTVTFVVTNKLTQTQKDYDDKTKLITERMSAKGTVVYTVRDIAEGQTIPSEAIEERQIELSKVPVDALTSATLAAGRIAKYGVSTGQLISQHDLLPQGISIGFESRLKQGMRAVTFAVDNNSGVAGFVAPESHVDIISMVGSGPETKARPILSDVEVIAVGQTFQKNGATTVAAPASSVTVSVNPEDTQKLIKGIIAGKLYLSLRSKSDHQPVATVDVISLFAKPAAPSQTLTALNLELPQPPAPPVGDTTQQQQQQMGITGDRSAAPVRTPHEVEAWAGSRKDIISVPVN